MYFLQVLCALAVAFLCNEVEASYIAVSPFSNWYPTRDYETLLFRIICSTKCTIRKITAGGYTGGLKMNAVDESGIFCSNQDSECPSIQLNGKIFFITVRPNPQFKGGNLTVELGQQGWIRELNAEGASIFDKTGSTPAPNYVRIKSGSFKIKFPNLRRIFEIKCNGNCRNIEFNSRTREKVKLVAAEEPVFATDGGCYNCLCESDKNQGYLKQCVNGGKKKFNLQQESIYVTMVPDKEITDVKAFVFGDNIESINEYVRNPDGWPVYDTKDGYRAVAFRFGPTAPTGTQTLLVVYCTETNPCDDVKIEVFADPTVKKINVGVIYWSGNCYKCGCNSVASCKIRKRPEQIQSPDGYYFFSILIKLDKSQKKYPGYIKISGKHIESIQVQYELGL